ncbi:type II secretion system GspH family protein [Patescibacteria group bacterium]|nr:type II secretion system GspH family protein [Patescibacteria group bacterium]
MLRKSLGFTLIELLVVITLIGVLAVAVLSALNPIEQINKARDAGKRADSSQLLTAIDRYFASNEKFPWNNYSTHIASVDLEFIATAEFVGVGVCGDGDQTDDAASGDASAINSDSGGCVDSAPEDDGYLVSTQELKRQFGKRPYFKSTAVEASKLFLYKAAGNPSLSVCFIPASKATRDKANDPNTPLKDLAVDGSGLPTQVEECAIPPTGDEWADVTTACFVCIPEE